MARFCSQCGKPLEEGQVCDCQEQNRRNAIEPVQKEVDQSAAAPQAAAGTVPPQLAREAASTTLARETMINCLQRIK